MRYRIGLLLKPPWFYRWDVLLWWVLDRSWHRLGGLQPSKNVLKQQFLWKKVKHIKCAIWNSKRRTAVPGGAGEVVSRPAARSPHPTRTGGQDDGSYTNSLKTVFVCVCSTWVRASSIRWICLVTKFHMFFESSSASRSCFNRSPTGELKNIHYALRQIYPSSQAWADRSEGCNSTFQKFKMVILFLMLFFIQT